MPAGGNFTGCNCGPDAETCASPTQPVATVGLCLADGTPIAVTVVRDCAGTITSEGWLNLSTGAFTPGPPPADATACDTGCVDTVCRQLCDDADGDGEADTTYSELWCIRADGSAELVLTYRDDPSQPYTPLAPVECTYGCPESETVTLCDDSGPFLRRYQFLNGVGTYEDFALDGQTPHVVTGTVGVCTGDSGSGGAPCAEQTTPAATLGLCLADGTPIAVVVTRDCAGTVTQDGWINLTSGTYSAGAPPAGTAACGDSRAFELTGILCDVDPATGDVLGLVLVEYAYNPDGSLASVRLVDPGTGNTYTLQGELRICPGGEAAATADLDLVVLCDVQADGTPVPFLRDYRRAPASGQITGFTDYGLDGTGYTPTGTVGSCFPEEAPCRDSSALLVCDLPTGGEPDPAVTDTDPTPYQDLPGSDAVDGGAAAVWSGGTLTIPPDTAAAADGHPQHLRTFAALVQAPRPGCDTGTATVTATVRVERTGPDPGCGGTGLFRLLAGGTTLSQQGITPSSVPVGTVRTLTVSAQVPAADLAAGNVALFGGLETYHRAPGSCPGGSNADGARIGGWRVNEFTADVVFDQAGCETQILRTVTVDCETGEVTSVADTTLDGQPYTPTGEVGQCTTTGGSACCPPEPCRDTSSLLLCDVVSQGEVSGALTASTVDDPSPFNAWRGYGAPATTWCQENGNPGAVFTGGATTLGPGTVCPTAGAGTHEVIAAVLGPPAADCDDFTVTASVRVENNGPAAGYQGDGRIALWNTRTGTRLTYANVTPSAAVGHVQTLTVSAPVSGEDLAAGYVAFSVDLEVEHQGAKSWTVDQFTADYAGVCLTSTQFLRLITTDCATGTVLTVTDTTLDGAPYAVTGEVGQCTAAGGGQHWPPPAPEPCRDTAALLLCDEGERPEQTHRIVKALWGQGGGTLPSGVTWSVAPATTNFPGSGGQTFTFSEPVRLRLAVSGLNGTDAPTSSTECIVLPAGAVLESLYANHSWDPATRTVCNITPCTTAPDAAACQAGQSVFVMTAEVTSVQVLGEESPALLRAVDWIDVTVGEPPVQFLRQIATDCETGTVLTVTDTTLDGAPYTVTGEVGQCATAGGGECCPEQPCPAHSVIEACRCDDTDGDGGADTDYVELLAVDCAGVLTSLGTYLPDLSGPYTPVAPIDCAETDDGAEPAAGVQARRVQIDPGGSWDAAAWPTLQSVTAVAHGGTGTVTTADGSSTLHVGEAATWSVARDTDALLTGPLSFTADTGTVTITYTTGVTL